MCPCELRKKPEAVALCVVCVAAFHSGGTGRCLKIQPATSKEAGMAGFVGGVSRYLRGRPQLDDSVGNNRNEN